MKHLSLDDIGRVLQTLDANEGSVPKAATHLEVSHTTLWRYLKKHAPNKLATRRERVNIDEVPIDVCVSIFRDARLAKLDITALVEKYGFSRKVIQTAVNRGRDETKRPTAARARSAD